MKRNLRSTWRKFLAYAVLPGLGALLLLGCNLQELGPQLGTGASGGRSRSVNTATLKGINHAHTWYSSQLTSALTGIKSWGANAVRVVLSSGYRWTKTSASEVSTIISTARSLGYTALVLEVHDTTGYGQDSAACNIASAVNYWKEIQSVLTGNEDLVIINIGNEPFGNWGFWDWTADHVSAIQALRAAGFTHTIMVDAPNWGQDWSFTMRDNAQTVYNADTRKDVIFSVHMYGVFDTAAEIQSYMKAFYDKGLKLVVGEFGDNHSDGNPDEVSILAYAKQYGFGYFGWSWCGNSGGVEYLDMVNAWNSGDPSTWGTWFKTVALAGSVTPTPSPTPTPTPSPTTSPGTTTLQLEAETGSLSGVYSATAASGYSGAGYVTGFDADGDSVTVTVTAAAAGNAALVIGYRSEFGAKTQYLKVNGNWVKDLTFPQSTSFTSLDAGTVYLNAGTNTINITKSWGWMDIDYFKLTGAISDGTNPLPTPTPTPTPTPSPTPTPVPGNLMVSYHCGNSSATTNSIKPEIRLVNNGASPVNLAGIELRYWYSAEMSQTQQATIYWASTGGVSGTYKVANSRAYIAFNFSSGTLGAASYVQINAGINSTDWRDYTQTNDWSFLASASSFVAQPKITAYQNGALVYGVEP